MEEYTHRLLLMQHDFENMSARICADPDDHGRTVTLDLTPRITYVVTHHMRCADTGKLADTKKTFASPVEASLYVHNFSKRQDEIK